MYQVKVYDENGDEVPVIETDVRDSGDPETDEILVYVSRLQSS